MTLRLAKIALIFGIAIYYTIVVLNNLADYDANLQVVRHVLLMDTTFPGNRSMWRALRNPSWQVAFYLAIIVWEVLTGFLCRLVPPSRQDGRRGTRVRSADVASGLSRCGRRMVSDVAIHYVERPGSRVSHVHCAWDRTADCGPS